MNRLSRGGPGERRRGWGVLGVVAALIVVAAVLWSRSPGGARPGLERLLAEPSGPRDTPARVLTAPKEPPVRADWPAGSLRAPRILLQFALAHLDPRTSRRAGALLRKLAARELPGFSGNDEVTRVRHDEKLLAASAAARQRLLAIVKPAWLAGRKPGEHLLVKGPFKTASGGREWMWLEVTAWRGKELSGILANEPEDVPGLHEGAPVSVEEGSVFDYLVHRADGSEEGNETGKLMEAAGAEP